MSSFSQAVRGFAALLATDPDPVLAASQVRSHRPGSNDDLPMVTVSFRLGAPGRKRGVGRMADGERPSRIPGDPPRPARFTTQAVGSAILEVWAAMDDEAVGLADEIERRTSDRELVRRLGFTVLEATRRGAARYGRHEAAAGGMFGAWAQRLRFHFHYDAPPVEESGGGVIDRVDVSISHDPKPGPEDWLVVPPPVTEGG